MPCKLCIRWDDVAISLFLFSHSQQELDGRALHHKPLPHHIKTRYDQGSRGWQETIHYTANTD